MLRCWHNVCDDWSLRSSSLYLSRASDHAVWLFGREKKKWYKRKVNVAERRSRATRVLFVILLDWKKCASSLEENIYPIHIFYFAASMSSFDHMFRSSHHHTITFALRDAKRKAHIVFFIPHTHTHIKRPFHIYTIATREMIANNASSHRVLQKKTIRERTARKEAVYSRSRDRATLYIYIYSYVRCISYVCWRCMLYAGHDRSVLFITRLIAPFSARINHSHAQAILYRMTIYLINWIKRVCFFEHF